MRTWTPSDLDLNDALNQRIWSQSPARLSPSVGAAQALLGLPALPWVPDLVGHRWQEPGAVIVVGSAYADFFTQFARRGRRMSLSSYRQAGSAEAFQRAFLRDVVQADSAYYQPVAALLTNAGVGLERAVLTDLCRASFVQIRDGASTAGDLIVRQHAELFHQHVEDNLPWHRARILGSGAAVIVALGNLAACGVSWLLDRLGWRHAGGRLAPQHRSAGWMKAPIPPKTGRAYTGPGGRRVVLLTVPHPSARNQAPSDSATVLAGLLGTSPVPLGAPTDGLWGAAFKPAKPLDAAVLLARHPAAASKTRVLLDGVSARRVVAITNALFNPCRPSNLPFTGSAAVEEGWRRLLSRRDQPYRREGTKWSRLVAALEPMPNWAGQRLAQMDILQLGSVAQAIVRGPYRSM